jgi:energy-coupling factor transporter ATP-binding protein EcfA2
MFDAATSAVDIVASTSRRGLRVPAMRVLREFAMNHSLSRGHLFIHGSAVALGESGILIAGPSGSGKTTLLMHLLSLGGAAYLSNDRVLARSVREGVRLSGMPAINTLRTSTLEMYPAVRETLVKSHWNHHRTIQESEQDSTPIKPWSDARYGLTPAQFCRLMGVESRASAIATAVLLPRQTHQPGHMTLTRLTPDVVEQRLHKAIFGIGCWSHETNLFALPADRAVIPATELRRRSGVFAASLPVFECGLGLQAYTDPDRTRALLSALSA